MNHQNDYQKLNSPFILILFYFIWATIEIWELITNVDGGGSLTVIWSNQGHYCKLNLLKAVYLGFSWGYIYTHIRLALLILIPIFLLLLLSYSSSHAFSPLHRIERINQENWLHDSRRWCVKICPYHLKMFPTFDVFSICGSEFFSFIFLVFPIRIDNFGWICAARQHIRVTDALKK